MAHGQTVYDLSEFRAAADPAGETDRLSTQDHMVLLGGNAADLDYSRQTFFRGAPDSRPSHHIANQYVTFASRMFSGSVPNGLDERISLWKASRPNADARSR